MLKNIKGFTLIELLVVIAIIGILSTIAVTSFATVQQSARDGKRRSEIDGLAKSIEASRDPVNSTYIYNSTNVSNDYPSGLPEDPLGAASRTYCVAVGSTTTPPSLPAVWTTSACPTTPVAYSTLSSAVAGSGILTTAVKSWTICASLEKPGAGVFCKTSLAR